MVAASKQKKHTLRQTVRVAVSQRVIPHYRISVFKNLAERSNIDLTVFFGKGLETGTAVNANIIEGFVHKKLFTLPLSFKRDGSMQLRVLHPFLLFYLFAGKFDVVIVEPTTNLYNDIGIFLFCKLFRRKFIWYAAGAGAPKERTLYRRLIDPIVSILTKYADAYITYNSFADNYLKEYFDAPDEKIFRAQNALDTTNITRDVKKWNSEIKFKKQELGIDNAKVALFIGGIEKRKRINNLIQAITEVNHKGIEAKTLIVGDGPDVDWVKEKMTEADRRNTIFAGTHISDAVLYLLMSDVIVLPAQGGLSINHAFACSKPFIGTRECVSGGDSIYDYVKDGHNGYVVAENDTDALSDKLFSLFSDDTLYMKLCSGALETSTRLDIPNMVDGIEAAIKYAARPDNAGVTEFKEGSNEK